MFEEYALHITVPRLIGRSGFVGAVASVEAAASNDIQEIMILGSCVLSNDATVCDGRIRLKFSVSVWYDLWKSH